MDKLSPSLSQGDLSSSLAQARTLLHLVPWTTRFLMGHQDLAVKGVHSALLEAPLPTFDQSSFTSESIVALQEVISQSIFTWFTEFGAQPVRFADPSMRKVLQGRLWDQKRWDHYSLTFTDESIDLIIAFYLSQQASLASIVHERINDLSLQSSGDRLLHTLLCLRAHRLSSDQNWSELPASLRLIFHRDPMYHLLNINKDIKGISGTQKVEYPWLLSKEISALWPWISTLITRAWLRDAPLKGRGVDQVTHHVTSIDEMKYTQFQRISDHQSVNLAKLIELAKAEERLDLLVPFIHYYSRLPQRLNDCAPSGVINKVNSLCHGVKLIDRPPIIKGFVDLLRGAHELKLLSERVSQTHPADREWPETLFLSVYQAAELEEATITLNEIANLLDPEIG